MCICYKNLYAVKFIYDRDITTYLQNVDCPKLNYCERYSGDKLTKSDECKDPLHSFKSNKSPG